MKITTIIFSFNRAMQLDAVLESLFFHCEDVEVANILVLYKTTNEYHEQQYRLLAKQYLGRVVFNKQKNFRTDILTLLCPFTENKAKKLAFNCLSAFGKIDLPFGLLIKQVWHRIFNPFLFFLSTILMITVSKKVFQFFLVDDNIFVQDFQIKKIVDVLEKKEDLLGFSLRLGKNTTYNYPMKRSQLVPEFKSLGDDVVYFKWDSSDGDFGYPLELSSSIYRLHDILPILMGFSFNNPNLLENQMVFSARFFRTKQPNLACYQQSVTFCNPINMVQSTISNRSGEKIRYEINELAERFEQGDRINVKIYNGFVPKSCHQEVEIFLVNK